MAFGNLANPIRTQHRLLPLPNKIRHRHRRTRIKPLTIRRDHLRVSRHNLVTHDLRQRRRQQLRVCTLYTQIHRLQQLLSRLFIWRLGRVPQAQLLLHPTECLHRARHHLLEIARSIQLVALHQRRRTMAKGFAVRRKKLREPLTIVVRMFGNRRRHRQQIRDRAVNILLTQTRIQKAIIGFELDRLRLQGQIALHHLQRLLIRRTHHLLQPRITSQRLRRLQLFKDLRLRQTIRLGHRQHPFQRLRIQHLLRRPLCRRRPNLQRRTEFLQKAIPIREF